MSLAFVVGELRAGNDAPKSSLGHPDDAVVQCWDDLAFTEIELCRVRPISRALDPLTPRQIAVVVDEDYVSLLSNGAVTVADVLYAEAFREAVSGCHF